MKIQTLFIALCVSISCVSQVSVGPSHIGGSSKFDKGVLNKFRNTETIFVLSNTIDQSEYERILKDSWDVTPYQVVSVNEFSMENYESNKYSFARLGGHKKTNTSNNSNKLYTYIDFMMYDWDEISEKLDGMSARKKRAKKEKIMSKNIQNIARVYIFHKAKFIKNSLSKSMNELANQLYNDDVFFNYTPGLLKNYFQRVNSAIKNEEILWMYESDYQPELKNLSSSTLYIPSYMSITYNGWAGIDTDEGVEYIEELFEDYDFKYEVIDDNELSKKILSSEEIYYIRYVRTNSERFLQVVNSKNGEIIYSDYTGGFSYNISSKHMKDLNKDIKRASKR